MVKKTTVKKHYRRTKKGLVPVRQHNRSIKRLKNRKAIGGDWREDMQRAMFGRSTRDAIKEGKCVTCGGPVSGTSFKDTKSRKEFEISGMCQKCQDEVFGKSRGAVFGLEQFGTGEIGQQVLAEQRDIQLQEMQDRDFQKRLDREIAKERRNVAIERAKERRSAIDEARRQEREVFSEMERKQRSFADMKRLSEAERVQQRQLRELEQEMGGSRKGGQFFRNVKTGAGILGKEIGKAKRSYDMKREGEKFLKQDLELKHKKEIKRPEFKPSAKAAEGFRGLFGGA